MTYESWEPCVAFALSGIGVGLILLYSGQSGLLDFPNHRSSHSVPTPRGGGIALVLSIVVMAGYELGRRGQRVSPQLLLLAGAVLTLTYVGWLDDKDSMPVLVRLPVHLACGIAIALFIDKLAPLLGVMNFAWLIWWTIWTAASINIVNFMDGIDGMVASQGIVYGIFLFALLPSDLFGSRFGLILAGACFGFLLWNWPPAKMFMGDVGSGPLGLFFVIGGALALQGAPAALVFLPLFPLFLDALLTLGIRLRRGERLTVAHRSHLYQRLANSGSGHALVTLLFALAAAVGALIALLAKQTTVERMWLAICVYVLAVGCAWKLADIRVQRRSHQGI